MGFFRWLVRNPKIAFLLCSYSNEPLMLFKQTKVIEESRKKLKFCVQQCMERRKSSMNKITWTSIYSDTFPFYGLFTLVSLNYRFIRFLVLILLLKVVGLTYITSKNFNNQKYICVILWAFNTTNRSSTLIV